MIIKDFSSLSDDDFNNIIEKSIDRDRKVLVKFFLPEYVAYNIASDYYNSLIVSEDFSLLVRTAIDDFASVTKDDCDLSQVKSILKYKYNIDDI